MQHVVVELLIGRLVRGLGEECPRLVVPPQCVCSGERGRRVTLYTLFGNFFGNNKIIRRGEGKEEQEGGQEGEKERQEGGQEGGQEGEKERQEGKNEGREDKKTEGGEVSGREGQEVKGMNTNLSVLVESATTCTGARGTWQDR